MTTTSHDSGQTSRGLALVLGATGGIGGEAAAALERRGWHVRALVRGGDTQLTAQHASHPDWELVTGNAMDAGSVTAAARGADVIVHAVNPPGYRNWGTLVLPMIDNTIAAARASGARVVLPGTIYNFGPDAFPVLREDSPQGATTHKGTIRVAMERRLEDATRDGVRSLIVRFGDFFGPRPGQSWFSQGMVTPNAPVTSVTYPGAEGTGHDWAYLPDAGETFARLLERDAELEMFARFHFGGTWDADGTQMIAAIRRAAGSPQIKVKSLHWPVLKLASPFNETMREISRSRPLWQTPIQLDNTRLVAFLGQEPHTPLNTAMEITLRGMGCLAS